MAGYEVLRQQVGPSRSVIFAITDSPMHAPAHCVGECNTCFHATVGAADADSDCESPGLSKAKLVVGCLRGVKMLLSGVSPGLPI
ncbi:hypothetical protein C5167_025831 [Papaver somniferum]|uniref:Uncharacterized protein n=1 Tax=Papaver somniferum TaxID=3469 RepID=A0A4Y7JVL6_PAPSO|nr:hypothetical protein C5167_025831 [Papaver somniferum]